MCSSDLHFTCTTSRAQLRADVHEDVVVARLQVVTPIKCERRSTASHRLTAGPLRAGPLLAELSRLSLYPEEGTIVLDDNQELLRCQRNVPARKLP